MQILYAEKIDEYNVIILFFVDEIESHLKNEIL